MLYAALNIANEPTEKLQTHKSRRHLKTRFDFEWHVVRRELLEHVVAESVNDSLAGFSTTCSCLLRLDA